jgi:hypothetical protein
MATRNAYEYFGLVAPEQHREQGDVPVVEPGL